MSQKFEFNKFSEFRSSGSPLCDEGFTAYVNQDFTTAFVLLVPFARDGQVLAQYFLGSMYYQGLGAPMDREVASEWFRLAAEQGNESAQVCLAFMYVNGTGVPKDYEEAFKWFRLAADLGDVEALFNLGVMYERGRGVERDYEKAARIYESAAQGGDASAWCNLGLMYEKGRGFKANKVAAYALYSLSVFYDSSPDVVGDEYRTNIAGKMTETQIEAGKALAVQIKLSPDILFHGLATSCSL